MPGHKRKTGVETCVHYYDKQYLKFTLQLMYGPTSFFPHLCFAKQPWVCGFHHHQNTRPNTKEKQINSSFSLMEEVSRQSWCPQGQSNKALMIPSWKTAWWWHMGSLYSYGPWEWLWFNVSTNTLSFWFRWCFFLKGVGNRNYYFNHFGVENDGQGEAAVLGHTLLFSSYQVTHG